MSNYTQITPKIASFSPSLLGRVGVGLQNLFLNLIFLLIPYFAQAQTLEKGTRRVGGSLNISNTNDDKIANASTVQTLHLHIQPSLGRFVTDRIELGYGIGYTFSDQTRILTYKNQTSKSRYIFHEGELLLYAKQHWWVAEKVALTARLAFTYGYSRGELQANDFTQIHTAMLQLAPTVLWVPTKHLGVEGSFGDVHFGNKYVLNAKDMAMNAIQDFGLDLSNGATLAVHYYW